MKNIIYIILVLLTAALLALFYQNKGENESIMKMINRNETNHYVIKYHHSEVVGDTMIIFFNKKNEKVGECQYNKLN